MLRKLMDKIRQILDRRPQPIDVHRPCDTCGQISGNLIDGLCDWCSRLFGAHK